MREFTLSAYKSILEAFQEEGRTFLRFEDFLTHPLPAKLVVLRHDVDRFPFNAVRMAELEAGMGIRSTYFYRTIPSVYKPALMKAVADLGHEVAYHYEDLSLAGGNMEKALEMFCENLGKIRKVYPARTICMHGSPLSRWDNKEIWRKGEEEKDYDYKSYGILGDTSFDVNYDEVFYITDNGWGWNKTSTSVRDKVDSRFEIPIENTDHFIKLIRDNGLPPQILFNTHPDSFFDSQVKWLLNKMFIQSKNLVKRQIVKYKIFK